MSGASMGPLFEQRTGYDGAGAPGSIRGSAPATSGGQGGAGVPDLDELHVRASRLVDKLDRATATLRELAASLGLPHG